METFEIIWGILLILFGLGLAGAIVYICLGAIGLIFLIPSTIASVILGFIGAILGISIIVLKELVLSAFKKLLALVGFESRANYSQTESKHSSKEEERSGSHTHATISTKLDPYQILQLSPGADRKDIKAAYLKAMLQYHPDKVSHLGKEFQTLAEERAKQIQHAYYMLRAA